MDSLTQQLSDFAKTKRVDLLGIAPIERFEGIAAEHHPASVFPETRSVLVIGKRIPRGALRGREEGTQMDLYEMYGRTWLEDRMLAITTISVAGFIEDHNWEAVSLQDLPPETPASGVPVREGAPAANVIVDVRDAAVRAGLGEIGYCGELLTPQFGPRQRCQLVLTDSTLEPTPMCTTPVCDQCKECVKTCPLGAFQAGAERTVEICGKTMVVADVDYDRCRSCKNGASPNRHHPAGRPDRLSALCVRSCLDHLERAERVENRFSNAFRVRPAWQMDAGGRASLQTD